MEAAIRQRVGGADYSAIAELVLDGCKFKDITAEDAEMLKQFRSLETLCCNRTGLKSLENLPPMPNLQSLEVTDNSISGGLEPLKQCSNLREVLLSGNKIKSLEALEPLKSLENLELVELELNPLTSNGSYRNEIFKLLPSLKVVDGKNRQGEDVEEALEDDEEDEEDDEEVDTQRVSLKEFYEKDIPDEESEEDNDYTPMSDEDEDEEFDEEDEEDEVDPESEAGKEESKGMDLCSPRNNSTEKAQGAA